MSTALAVRPATPASADLDQALDQVEAAIARVDALGDSRSLSEARIALNAARELARLNRTSRALRARLTRLEMHIARRAGQLGVKVAGINGAVTAWYATKTDDEIDALVGRHCSKSAAASIMKAELALGQYLTARATAAQPASINRLEVADAAETLAALVTAAQDHFYGQDAVEIGEITDYVGTLVGVPSFDESAEVAGLEGLRLGLWDAVRKSLATGDLDDPRLRGLPRWITCIGREDTGGDSRYNVRVPTAKANLRQLEEYVDLLDRKGRESIARAERVAEILDDLRAAVRNAGAVDGESKYVIDQTSVGEAAALMFSGDAS